MRRKTCKTLTIPAETMAQLVFASKPANDVPGEENVPEVIDDETTPPFPALGDEAGEQELLDLIEKMGVA
jgi:hypothetical protein